MKELRKRNFENIFQFVKYTLSRLKSSKIVKVGLGGNRCVGRYVWAFIETKEKPLQSVEHETVYFYSEEDRDSFLDKLFSHTQMEVLGLYDYDETYYGLNTHLWVVDYKLAVV